MESNKNDNEVLSNFVNTEYENTVVHEPVADELERQHFQKIVNAFKFYRVHSLRRVLAAEKYYSELPEHHRQLLPRFRNGLEAIRTCIDHNYEIIKLITADADTLFENRHNNTVVDGTLGVASEFDMEKVRTTLKQIVRDWSDDGAAERSACYQPVIDEIVRRFPNDGRDISQVSILIPGAGLGRLAYEVAQLGYSCQGNEVSLFMLLTSNFILNKCKYANNYRLYPWVHQYCNNMTSADQIRQIQFPDINPADLPFDANFSMAAGDFLDVYQEPESWDCIATVFFIDTAHNIVEYIETIWNILKPGGYWINFGPLLYHFADMANESSIELSYSDVKDVIHKLNFEILSEEIRTASYTQNARAMLRYEYDCVFFVARKVAAPR